jgi:hypothetical protein
LKTLVVLGRVLCDGDELFFLFFFMFGLFVTDRAL